MAEHLRTWTFDDGRVLGRLDLWTTGRQDDRGQDVLHYALWLHDMAEGSGAIIEGDDYSPSPLHALDSDDSAAGILTFFYSYGSHLRFGADDPTGFPAISAQRPANCSRAHYEVIGLWSLLNTPCFVRERRPAELMLAGAVGLSQRQTKLGSRSARRSTRRWCRDPSPRDRGWSTSWAATPCPNR